MKFATIFALAASASAAAVQVRDDWNQWQASTVTVYSTVTATKTVPTTVISVSTSVTTKVVPTTITSVVTSVVTSVSTKTVTVSAGGWGNWGNP